MIYYVDPINGKKENDGKSAEKAILCYRDIDVKPGDTVLFKRGSFMRDTLDRVEGETGRRVTYGAYGEGPAPVFCGSVDVSSADLWEEVRPRIWRLVYDLPSEAANFIFDGGRTGAALRWHEKDLKSQGDWYDSGAGKTEAHTHTGDRAVLMYSETNPGQFYSHIECAVWGKRYLSVNKDNTTCEDLCFFGSGVHALSGKCRNMTVRRCSFIFIGGAVWNRQLRIRFGNAIEFWEYGEDILIENCYFNNIYDSCITEQGSAACQPAKNFVMRNNLFINYGMGAYEGRDRMPVNTVFEDNLCIYAGGGFSAFGDTLPRNSEIYPQPMGHHIFMWRIPAPSDGGSFTIARNRFYDASGAAVYSIISRGAEKQMHIENNKYYTSSKTLLNYVGGVGYSGFDEYISDYGENGAEYVPTPNIEAEAEKWFDNSECDRHGEALFTDELPARKYFIGSTEKDALSYKKGEDICFRLTLTEGGKKIGCPLFAYVRRGDDGVTDEGTVNGESGVFVYHTSLGREGYVYLEVRACDEKGIPLEKYEYFKGGACADFDSITAAHSATDECDDFIRDAVRDELDRVSPVLDDKKEFVCGDPGDVVYDVKIACAGERSVSGYLRLPRDAHDGELPVIIEYQDSRKASADVPHKNRAIQFTINMYGINNGEDDEYYDGIDVGGETDDLKYTILRAIQAVRFCRTLSCWDGKNIILRGDGMGAVQALWTAAYEPCITKLEINMPRLCDIHGVDIGKLGSEVSCAPDFFDAALLGRKVKCECRITAGLGDCVSPPSGVTALYNSLTAEKHLVMRQNADHYLTSPDSCEYVRDALDPK